MELTFFAGPYAGYLLSANSEITEGNDTNNEDIEDRRKKQISEPSSAEE